MGEDVKKRHVDVHAHALRQGPKVHIKCASINEMPNQAIVASQMSIVVRHRYVWRRRSRFEVPFKFRFDEK